MAYLVLLSHVCSRIATGIGSPAHMYALAERSLGSADGFHFA
jgi:hypothetical protein